MATFAAIVGSDIVFPKSFRGVGGGSYQTNNIDSLFTPRGFIAPCWTGATVMSDYINGRCVPKRSACSGELGYYITHDAKVYAVDLWREDSIPKNGSPMSLMEVYYGKDCFNVVTSPQATGAAVSTAFHLCNNDFEKAMRLLGRRHNICIQDYVCMSIPDIAKRLTEEGKTGNMLALEPIRFSEAD